MYIVIDRFEMEVLYRCEKVETIRALCHIELPNYSISILEETCIGALLQFSVKNLQDLFESLTGGTNPHSHNAQYLAGQVSRLCQTCTPTDVQDFEVIVQSLQIKERDKKCYKYIKGGQRAVEVEENVPKALIGNWQAAQDLALPGAEIKAPSPVKPVQSWATVQTTPPKYAPPWA